MNPFHQFVIIFNVFFVLTGLGALSACSWNVDSRPSVLVIAVESLGFNDVSCGSTRLLEPDMEGFRVFCEDSVRFTHAFTPSLMSQSSLASVMTGLYPNEHQVFHNGDQFLSAKHNTVAEWALEQNYRTSFFSGGAPIWHKSGLSQGFELFEDNISVDLNRLYRPAKENFEHFFKWYDEEVHEQAFFSVVYLNDLLYPDVTTSNDLGEIRDRSLDSQFREVSESLNYLVNGLKERGLWEGTHIVLMGLNGQAERDRLSDIDAFSMFSLSTQVGLFIKPSRLKRDKGIEWSQDKNVSLVDVGETLFDLIGEGQGLRRSSRQPVVSLKTALSRPEAGIPEDRDIWIESDWPEWREFGGRRVAARKGQYLVIFDDPIQLYNTLIDRFETTPVPEGDPIWRTVVPDLLASFQTENYHLWSNLPESLLGKLRLAISFWTPGGFTDDNIEQLRFLARLRPWDSQLVGWQAYAALERKDWVWLKQLGLQNNNFLWAFLAAEHLGQTTKLKPSFCDRMFLIKKGEFRLPHPEVCEDRLLIDLVEWATETDPEKANQLFESFWRKYRIAKTDEWVGRYNYANSLIWDVSASAISQPLLADLYLLLPGHEEMLNRLTHRMSGKDFRFHLSSPFEF